MLKVTVTFTFDLLTLKSIGIIYESWPNETSFTVSLSLMTMRAILASNDKFNYFGYLKPD